MSDYILSRNILIIVFALHCLIALFGSSAKATVSAKTLKTIFGVETFLITAYVIYTCIAEPFYNGVAAALFGYTMVYFIIWLSCCCLKHWLIVPNKVYDFYPDKDRNHNIEENIIGGWIKESGVKIYVCINDNDWYERSQGTGTVKVKYRDWKNSTAFFDVV